MAGAGTRSGKTGSMVARGTVRYAHDDVNELAASFRSIDARRNDRLIGLRNMKRLVDHYHQGAAAKDWHAVVDKQIARETSRQAATAARNARRRVARPATRTEI